ncbi:MAG TPA: c-type cytochrome [Bacteroidales bacterium]|nr:c-type cytochrome [Bacteroidales bacterium]
MIQRISARRNPFRRNHLFVFVFLVELVFILFAHTPVRAQEDPATLFQVCAACHTIGKGKLVGPDLQGITERREEAWLIRFIRNSQLIIQEGDPVAVRLFEEYNKIPMPPNDLSDDQIRSLLKYIETTGKQGTGNAGAATAQPGPAAPPKGQAISQKPAVTEEIPLPLERNSNRNFLAIFLVTLLIFFLSIIDLAVTKLIKARFIHVIIILTALFVMGEIVVVEAKSLGRQQYYSPDQPVKFSHKIHAGQNRINCKYCHFTAEESKYAGFPPVQLCMNCHSLVKEGKITGTEEISKIYKALETGKPIPWIRVHNLPDHSYFNHAQHVKVGKVTCNECHGPVEKMDRIIQVNSLGMGWCIECHRTREVQFFDNEFYTRYTIMHDKIKSGEKSKVTVDDMGGTECGRCHY